MTGLLLSILFAAPAVFAIATIITGWRRHGADRLAIGQQLRAVTDQRECRYTITTIEVRPAAAAVYRPDFRAEMRRRPMQPNRIQQGQRAAA